MTYPVTLKVDYPEKLSRLTTFFRFLTLIPAVFVLAFVSIAGYLMYVLSWFAILFTGKYPQTFFDFVSYWFRWALRVVGYAGLLTDKYPPFSGDVSVDYPVKIDVERPAAVSRLLTLLRLPIGGAPGFVVPSNWRFASSWLAGFPMAFPHEVILSFLGIAVGVIVFLSWWAILFTGKYPKSFFTFVVWVFRWSARVTGYTYFFTDMYPPFTGDE